MWERDQALQFELGIPRGGLWMAHSVPPTIGVDGVPVSKHFDFYVRGTGRAPEFAKLCSREMLQNFEARELIKATYNDAKGKLTKPPVITQSTCCSQCFRLVVQNRL